MVNCVHAADLRILNMILGGKEALCSVSINTRLIFFTLIFNFVSFQSLRFVVLFQQFHKVWRYQDHTLKCPVLQ